MEIEVSILISCTLCFGVANGVFRPDLYLTSIKRQHSHSLLVHVVLLFSMQASTTRRRWLSGAAWATSRRASWPATASLTSHTTPSVTAVPVPVLLGIRVVLEGGVVSRCPIGAGPLQTRSRFFVLPVWRWCVYVCAECEERFVSKSGKNEC